MICCCGILRLVASSYHVVPGGAKTSLHLQWPRTEGGRVTLKEVYQALVARGLADDPRGEDGISRVLAATKKEYEDLSQDCLLYTSDAADDLLCVDLGGRRIIKKKKKKKKHN